jgi:hypothetical protein
LGAIAMAASLAMTAVYHAGYSDFRSDKMRKPVTGDLVWSVPPLATLNPIGAPVAHVSPHVGAVVDNHEICSSRLTEARKQARPATNKPSRVAG